MRYTDRIYNVEHTANQALDRLSKELEAVLLPRFEAASPEVTHCVVELKYNVVEIWLGKRVRKQRVRYNLSGISSDHRYLKIRRWSDLPNDSRKLNDTFKQIIFDVLTEDEKEA